MDGIIYVSTALIEHCFLFEFPAFSDMAADSKLVENLKRPAMAAAMYGWVIAHEFFYIVRGHNQVGNTIGTELLTSRALEHDADLCAAAALFRQFQFRYRSVLVDHDIRCLTLYSLFWALRTLLLRRPQVSHSSIAERLWNILTKLAVIPECADGNQKVDTTWSDDRSLRSLAALQLIFVKCERHYLATVPEASSLLIELAAFKESGELDAVVHEWMSIRDHVAAESKTRT